jgi:hypothetical protein
LRQPGNQDTRAIDLDHHGDGNRRSNSTDNGPDSYCELSSGVRRLASVVYLKFAAQLEAYWLCGKR